MNQIRTTLQHYLVDHPNIQNFKWIPGETLASAPQFPAAAILTYLSLTVLLSRNPSLLPTLPPTFLKPLTALHSLTLLLLSSAMFLGGLLSLPSLRRAVCFTPGTPPTGPLFFWAHVFYLSKFLEFGDTALILLGKSVRRLTFLHVYHHSMVVVMCYLWLETSQSLFPVALVTNAGVHVVMYGYYMLCAVALKPRWKRLVTDCQIVQFVFSFGISGLMLYYHFGGGGCSGMWAWVFNAGFNGSLLVLFVDFHGRSYGGGGDMTKKKMKIGGGGDDKVKRP